MLKRSLAVASAGLVVAVLAVAAPFASAAHASHAIKLTLHSFNTGSKGKPDQPGNRQTGVGLVTGQPIGQGVSTLSDKVTSASQSGIKFVGVFTIYTVHGSMTGKIHLTVKPNSSGGATGSGTGKLVSGTGAYKGITGSFTFRGDQSPNAPDFTAHLEGSATY